MFFDIRVANTRDFSRVRVHGFKCLKVGDSHVLVTLRLASLFLADILSKNMAIHHVTCQVLDKGQEWLNSSQSKQCVY